jgi:hypothetical protein
MLDADEDDEDDEINKEQLNKRLKSQEEERKTNLRIHSIDANDDPQPLLIPTIEQLHEPQPSKKAHRPTPTVRQKEPYFDKKVAPEPLPETHEDVKPKKEATKEPRPANKVVKPTPPRRPGEHESSLQERVSKNKQKL